MRHRFSCQSRKIPHDPEQLSPWATATEPEIQSLCTATKSGPYLLQLEKTGRNINNLRYTADTTIMEESKEELKSLLMRVKEESEQVGLKHNIKETKIMETGTNNFMANSRGKVKAVTNFIFVGSQITADSDCSCEIKRCLLLGRKTMTNLDIILKSKYIKKQNKQTKKSKDIPLPTKSE